MSALQRFVKLGMKDADARVAAALAPPPLEPADRYLEQSALIKRIDRVTLRLHQWWHASEAEQWRSRSADAFAKLTWSERYQSIGTVVLSAVVVNVMMMLLQGPRPGFFWTIVPALAAAFAVTLLAASKSTH